MKQPTKIHEFDPVIYPVKLWVLIAEDSEYLRSKFVYYPSKENIPIDTFNNIDGCVDTVMMKSNSKIGVLITFRDLEACTMGTIAHEATHASIRMWKRIGERRFGSEANAYLVEWIVKCCEKVKMNKI